MDQGLNYKRTNIISSFTLEAESNLQDGVAHGDDDDRCYTEEHKNVRMSQRQTTTENYDI